MADHGIPYLRVLVFSLAKLLQLVVVVNPDIISSPAFHEVDEILLLEVLLEHAYGPQDNGELLLRINPLLGVYAVVTHPAVVLRILLSEVVE